MGKEYQAFKHLIEKYAPAVEKKSKSIFDDDQSQSTKIIFKIPFLSEFELKNITICCECEISKIVGLSYTFNITTYSINSHISL